MGVSKPTRVITTPYSSWDLVEEAKVDNHRTHILSFVGKEGFIKHSALGIIFC